MVLEGLEGQREKGMCWRGGCWSKRRERESVYAQVGAGAEAEEEGESQEDSALNTEPVVGFDLGALRS